MFIVLGIAHFVWPNAYAKIMPPIFPRPELLVAISGAAEIAGGIGLLIPALRRAAAWGLILLLIAVFPANIYMAGWRDQIGLTTAPVWLWLRLPLQFLIMAWVWDVGLRRDAAVDDDDDDAHVVGAVA
jgi:uncharacterized membrane protein